MGEENGSEKIVGLKKIGLDKFLFKRFVGYKKMLGPKNVLRWNFFGVKIIFGTKICGSKKMLVPINYGSKEVFGPKNLWSW